LPETALAARRNAVPQWFSIFGHSKKGLQI
jgi:hypothetical protein